MMTSALRVAFLLLLVTGIVTGKESDLSDAPDGDDLNHEAAAQRMKRRIGLFDGWGKDIVGFSSNDALKPDLKTAKPAAVNSGGFNLEDALRPAQKPTDGPKGGECAGNLVEKLNAVIENQNQQLRLLKQMTPTSRFYEPRAR